MTGSLLDVFYPFVDTWDITCPIPWTLELLNLKGQQSVQLCSRAVGIS